MERARPGPSVVTVGNFDGVHRGHQSILARARELATQASARLVVVTFEPHPASVLRPGGAPPLLTDLPERLSRLEQAGVDQVLLLDPLAGVLEQSAEQFVRAVLVERLGCRAVVEGPGFRFGRDRTGDLAVLARLGRALGFDVHEVAPCPLRPGDVRIVCSSLIRELIAAGDLAAAKAGLGRPVRLCGQVVRGRQIGRTLGFPTANIDCRALQAPPAGVYAGRALLPDGRWALAAMNIGTRPSIAPQDPPCCEAHLLDVEVDLYDQRLCVDIVQRLRDIERFGSVEELGLAIAADVAQVRSLLAGATDDRMRSAQAATGATPGVMSARPVQACQEPAKQPTG